MNYVEGLKPILDQLVLQVTALSKDADTNARRRSESTNESPEYGSDTSSNYGASSGMRMMDLNRLIKTTASDNNKVSDIMQVGINLCGELVDFLSPLDAHGQVSTEVAHSRRTLLQTFGVVEKLTRILHSVLVGQTGKDLHDVKHTLNSLEKGSSLLYALWQESLKVLSIASFDHLQTGSSERSGVKEYLVNFFRTFTVHLMYFDSSRAAHVLVALAKGNREVCDQILKDPEDPDEELAGDFRFLLSYLGLPDTGNTGHTISFEYFNVLKAFCIHGNQAVVKVQKMIGEAMTGR